ncbi:MAG: addiction module toxin RelE [Candidatus Altiarchaeota archaeon]
MYELELSEKLEKILGKLLNKDKVRYEATLKKMGEISTSTNIHHYKNLKHTMKGFKRVHIDSHFVLIFRVDENRNAIRFEDLQHHDHIY